MQDRWSSGPLPGANPLEELVHLSRLIGGEETLVQPGGGNTSVKARHADAEGDAEVLLVKGSGTDLATIRAEGFTELSMRRLARLAAAGEMTDEAMMAFLRSAMLRPHADPVPSVETPLHSVLPHRVIVHTHDVATMSLTNVRDETAERLVREVLGGDVHYVPYARPGFPLARAVAALGQEGIPERAHGLALAHHGLVVWANDARECYRRLVSAVSRMEEAFESRRRGRRVFGAPAAAAPGAADAEARAALLFPVIRGALGAAERVVLHWDRSERVLETIAGERAEELTARGMVTPEHILRAGRLPLFLKLDLGAPADELMRRAREALADARRGYEEYHRRHARSGEAPIADWAKVVLIPGLGMVTAFHDKRSALVANTCYRAGLQAIENAEALEGFRFLDERDVFFFEHWPLERRKVEETIVKERQALLLPRRIALVIGGASGIGEAAARRFADEGAHVVVADLDGERARAVAGSIAEKRPHRSVGVAADVRDERSIEAAVRVAVLEFGGLDVLFYTPGVAPRFAPVTELERSDLESQLQVHYVGAVLAIREAARVMQRQGLGGSILCSVSKAALAPGRDALAYAGSKAALQHALRVAALELGPAGIRVNAINADQVDTPMFRRFVEERARARGRSADEQLEEYRKRNAMGVGLIPPEAVADLAALLASDRFRYTTGDILTIDGGLTAAGPR
jgi:rhamnose utilization protein RhaD (predicted bifunctional aldolase and dehydrogenase)/NAD(P)-dependent dehydrogenase (short-subunit alcohol dehydrogenase family)